MESRDEIQVEMRTERAVASDTSSSDKVASAEVAASCHIAWRGSEEKSVAPHHHRTVGYRTCSGGIQPPWQAQNERLVKLVHALQKHQRRMESGLDSWSSKPK